jgi:hypothetical protein
MKEIFGIKGKVINYPNVAENVINSKPLVLLFQQIFKYTEGFHKTFSVKPPSFLRSLNWAERKYFTTGLMDTDGSFYYDKSTRTVMFEIKMKNPYLIEEVRFAFNVHNINYDYRAYPIENPEVYRVRAVGKETLKSIKTNFNPKNEKHLKKLKSFNL